MMPEIPYDAGIVHRYNVMLDVLESYKLNCSEVYRYASGCPEYHEFKWLFVVPTTALNCELVVYGRATSRQFKITCTENWPGGKKPYKIRVNFKEPKFTTISRLKYVMHPTKAWSSSQLYFAVKADNINDCLEPTAEELSKAKLQAKYQTKWETLTRLLKSNLHIKPTINESHQNL